MEDFAHALCDGGHNTEDEEEGCSAEVGEELREAAVAKVERVEDAQRDGSKEEDAHDDRKAGEDHNPRTLR